MDRTTLESDFEKDSNEIFKNNTTNYTENDKEFLKQMNQMFGNALSAKGLNLLDPIYANMFHYNKMSMRGNVDGPKVTRTYVFFTRPELNFSFENIQAVPFFKWIHSKRIGKMVMAALTDPNYFINAPTALNSASQLDYKDLARVIKEYSSEMHKIHKGFDSESMKNADKEWADTANNEGNAVFDTSNVNIEDAVKEKDVSEQDNAQEVAALNELNIDSIYNSATYDELVKIGTHLDNSANWYNSAYTQTNTYLAALTNKLATASGSATKDQNLAKSLAEDNLYLAKHILRTKGHDRNGDRFMYTTPWIPLLQNTCTQLTGAKDLSLETHDYEPDKYGRTTKVATGMDEIFGPGTFNTSFEDIMYSPVSLLFIIWIMYIHYVSRGFIMTTREHITERILDYTCSAYVFVVGEDGRRIERMAKYTGCYPTTFPLSGQLDHNTNVDTDMLQKISVSWVYNRYEPMDPQIFTDFNFLSETEWLVKPRDPFWDSIYNRYLNIHTEAYQDLTTPKNPYERAILRGMNRPEEIWEVVTKDQMGMSGKLPPTLIEAENEDSAINMINNFWGGYPYINNGAELIWVLPQYGVSQGINRDVFKSGKNISNNSSSSSEKSIDPSKQSTGFEKSLDQRLAGSSAEKDILVGNATGIYDSSGLA